MHPAHPPPRPHAWSSCLAWRRRALAAAERLVILCGERCPKERRDLAVLYLHCGRLAAARAELEVFEARAAKVRWLGRMCGFSLPSSCQLLGLGSRAAKVGCASRWQHGETATSIPSPHSLRLQPEV